MGRKATADELLEQVEWIEHLENGGGSWGRGVILTLKDQAKEIRRLNGVLGDIKLQISDRCKLMRSTVARVEREAELTGNSKDQINDAQVEVEVKRQEAAEAKTKAEAEATANTKE